MFSPQVITNVQAALAILQSDSSAAWMRFATQLLSKSVRTLDRQLAIHEEYDENPLGTSLSPELFEKGFCFRSLKGKKAVPPRTADEPDLHSEDLTVEHGDGGNVSGVDPSLQIPALAVLEPGILNTDEAGEAGIGSHEIEPEFFAAFTEAEKTMIRREAINRQVSPVELLRDWILEFANPQN